MNTQNIMKKFLDLKPNKKAHRTSRWDLHRDLQAWLFLGLSTGDSMGTVAQGSQWMGTDGDTTVPEVA